MAFWRKPSLSLLMSVVIFMTTAVFFGLYTAYEINKELSAQTKIILDNVTESAQRLSGTAAPFIESYSINEYEILIASEVQQNKHKHLAIIIDDHNMGKIMGESAYVSGVIKNTENSYEKYDPNNARHQERLKKSNFLETSNILSKQGKLIGRVKVYGDDRLIDETVNDLFKSNIIAAAAAYFLFSITLLYLTKRFFIKPLEMIASYLTEHKYNESPPVAPKFSYKELIDFSEEVNALVKDIQQAKNTAETERVRLQSVIDGTNSGTWEWNVQTGETVFNQRWAEIIGYKLNELSPISIATWEKFSHPEDLKISEKILQQVFSRQKKFYECEVRMKHKDGRWIWVLDRGQVIQWSDDGQPLKMSGTHTDITVLKEHEKQLESAVQERTQELVQARDKADVANLAKSRFLANMSHELRTPMHAIHSFTKLALKRQIDSKARHFLENIDVSTDRLTNLLNDLLDLSKLESGKTELNLEEQDIRDLILTTINSLDSLIKEHNLVLDLSSLSVVKLQIDKNLMSQVITNLFSNAIKFSPDNGKIYVVSKVVDESCQVSIEDEGIGIPEDEYESIFDSFVQSSKTMTDAGGTGLGLPITKEIIELHQGEIWVKSPPEGKNVGSIFTFKIPINHFN